MRVISQSFAHGRGQHRSCTPSALRDDPRHIPEVIGAITIDGSL